MDRQGSHRRAYEPWTDEYNIELIELLRAGRRLGEIAEATGRSEGAVRTQCRNLLPPDLPTSGNAVRTLQTLLSDPDYDWREAARARYRRARQVYWDIDMDTRLRSAWADRRRLAELTTEFDASEVEIARQLMRLGLAENASQVADRLGCDPTGALAGRIRLAHDHTASAVWVLVVDGTGQSTGFDDLGPARRHISIHPDPDSADNALADHDTTGLNPGPLTASIVERALGEFDFGTSRHLTSPEPELLPEPADGRPWQDPWPAELATDIVDLDDDNPAPGPVSRLPGAALLQRLRRNRSQ